MANKCHNILMLNNRNYFGIKNSNKYELLAFRFMFVVMPNYLNVIVTISEVIQRTGYVSNDLMYLIQNICLLKS